MPEISDKTIPVRVALRIRPLLPREVADGCQECITVTPGEPQVVMGNDKAFTYDYVYGTLTKQSNLYEETVRPLLEQLFKGYNATVLAYGQTGSGKTYSMGTSFTAVSNSNDKEIQGVIPRVVTDIFEYVDSQKETEFLLKCSFLEIHNEEIHDLLNANALSDKIAIRENIEGGIMIAGLSELPVSSGAEMAKLLCNGSASRATGATAMNSTSSRSHAIFSIIMEQKDKTAGDFKRAKFHLVDLAGSERAKRTNAQGERFKEGVNINKGLLALGNVISALSDENRKSNAHVPYRDSKLTRLLQDSLGGNSNTVMIACVSPADSNYEETLNTLRYADRARQIKNKPIINRDPVAAEMAKLKQQVQMLQLQLIQGQTINGGLTEGLNLQEVADRVKQLEGENMKLSQELHNSVNQNTTLYEKVLMAELARDKIIRQYDELKHYLTKNKVKLMPSLTEAISDNKEQETDLASELQKKFHQFEETCTFEQNNNDSQETIPDHLNHSCEAECSINQSPNINSSFESQHALRQAELGRQVQELTKALSLKEELAAKMQQNEGAMNEKMLKQYEVTVRDLEAEISKLEQQKAELSLALTAAKTSHNDSDSSKSRVRIKELEAKINEMKKKQLEIQKLQRLKQQSDSTITKLNTEIQSMKSTRVKLMRQMKEESERFRNLKKEKEKEIMQLKQMDRKRQFEYTKLQNIHQKQQAVLKRKTEEAAAANKRLHDALSKRKEAADKRENNQNLQNRQADGFIPRMKSWLSHEVEVLVSILHAKKTLEELIEDRKIISHHLHELREQEADQPPTKKMFPAESDDSKDSKNGEPETQVKINTLEAELNLKTSQIAELQKKLVDAESNVSSEKSKHRWNNIHTMAEAKASLQVLLSMAVEAKSKQIGIEKEVDENHKELQELRQSTKSLAKSHTNQLDFLRRDYDKRIVMVQKENEEKVLLLLQQIPTEEEKNEVVRLRELVQLKDTELAEKQKENDVLQQRFAAFSDALSNEMPSMRELSKAVEETSTQGEQAGSRSDEMEVEDIENEDLEESFDHQDSIENDPDWVFDPSSEPETPMPVRRSNARFSLMPVAEVDNCSCSGKCKRNCPCKKKSEFCSALCRCKQRTCSNKPKDPKTPIVEFSSDSDLSIEKENLSPLLSKEKKDLKTVTSNATPKAQENEKRQMKKAIEKSKDKLLKKPVMEFSSDGSNLPVGKVIASPLLESKPQKQSYKDSHVLKAVNAMVTPKVEENEKPKIKKTFNKPKDQENKIQLLSRSVKSTKSEKWRKIRRKSGVLSKKQGIRTTFTTAPRHSVLSTPGSDFTPTKSISKTPKSLVNAKKNNMNATTKQRKRKLHNPSALPSTVIS